MPQHAHAILKPEFRDLPAQGRFVIVSAPAAAGDQQLDIDAVIRQLKGSMVDGDAGFGSENFVSSNGPLREPYAQAT